MMSPFPKNKMRLKTKLERYKKILHAEKQRFGGYDDSAGLRYLLGPMYMLLDDNTGALRSFSWFAHAFPDDVGEPGFLLCWTLALHQATGNRKRKAAIDKLKQTMLSNLYVLPHLLGEPQERYDIWHSSNWEEPDYAAYIPPELFDLWDDEALQWAAEQYYGPELTTARDRYIEIYRQLPHTPVGPERNALVQEASRLQRDT